jgi:riboflavin synthase
MFTGNVQHLGCIASVEPQPFGAAVEVDSLGWEHHPNHGESIAVNGCCLTVASKSGRGVLRFDVVHQTLRTTTLGELSAGCAVNLEHAVTPQTMLGGHVVQGHVDGVGDIAEVTAADDEWRITVTPPEDMRDYIVPKGSITIDGVSLTIAAVRDKGDFEVALIPTTLNLTTLGKARPGTLVNLESDIISRTVVHHLRQRQKGWGLNMDDLRAAGFVE